MFDPQVIVFTGIAALLTITPGSDTMLILRSIFRRGEKAAALTMIGICSGLFFHAVLSALGLSLILLRSAIAFEIVKLLGACYLIYLGGQSLWRTKQSQVDDHFSSADDRVTEHKSENWRGFFEGTITNVLNPKVAIFYLAFLPQFIGPGDWILGKSILLATIHFAEGIIWYSILIFLLGRMRGLFIRPRIRRGLEALSGIVLIAFGVRLAGERR